MLKIYNMFQPFGHHQILSLHPDLPALFPTLANVHIWMYFLLSVIYILVECPCNDFSCNNEISKYEMHF